MEISETRLRSLASTNARAKVMVKQWYPDLFIDGEIVVPHTQIELLQAVREASPVRQGTLRRDVGDRRDANGDTLIRGRWYTDNENHLMLYEGDLTNSKGFYDGNWGTTWCFPHPESSVPASRELLQSVLRQECINRGYNASNFLSFAGSYHRNHPIQVWHYDENADSMYAAPHGMGGLCMYRRGLWADINNNDTVIEITSTPNDNQWWDF